MNLIKCIMTNSLWYKQGEHNSTPVGVLWHDTGAGNPNIKRYVQPMEGEADYNKLIQIIGKNNNANDWNHAQVNKGVNAVIGKLANGSVGTVQTGEWEIAPWGCWHGTKGSCNGYIKVGNEYDYQGKHWIQVEICDDFYKDKNYFEKVYKEACELTAYLCKLYKIDPYGTANFNGVTVPTILCHQDAYNLKLGSNHGDVYLWFKAMGRAQNMDKVRADVATLMGIAKEESNMDMFKLGDIVKIKPEVTTYYNGTTMPQWVKKSTLYVRGFKTENRVIISTQQSGAVTGTVYEKDLELVKSAETEVKEEPKIEETSKVEEKPVVETPPVVEVPTVDETPKSSGGIGALLRELLELLLKLLKK